MDLDRAAKGLDMQKMSLNAKTPMSNRILTTQVLGTSCRTWAQRMGPWGRTDAVALPALPRPQPQRAPEPPRLAPRYQHLQATSQKFFKTLQEHSDAVFALEDKDPTASG
eukprot:3998846-Pyramimonas_sp.AAC.1